MLFPIFFRKKLWTLKWKSGQGDIEEMCILLTQCKILYRHRLFHLVQIVHKQVIYFQWPFPLLVYSIACMCKTGYCMLGKYELGHASSRKYGKRGKPFLVGEFTIGLNLICLILIRKKHHCIWHNHRVIRRRRLSTSWWWCSHELSQPSRH